MIKKKITSANSKYDTFFMQWRLWYSFPFHNLQFFNMKIMSENWGLGKTTAPNWCSKLAKFYIVLWLTFCEHKNFVLQFSGRQFFCRLFSKVHFLTSENKKTVVMRCTLPIQKYNYGSQKKNTIRIFPKSHSLCRART